METNQKQKKEELMGQIYFGLIIIILAGFFLYIYQQQKATIADIQTSVQKLQADNKTLTTNLASTTKMLNQTNDDLDFVRYLCQADKDCKQRMSDHLQESLLKRNGFTDFSEEGGGSGLNFHKYVIDPPKSGGEDGLDPGMISNTVINFVKAQCPARIYNQQDFLVQEKIYRISLTKTVTILMDDNEPPTEIMCAWTEDTATKQFTIIN